METTPCPSLFNGEVTNLIEKDRRFVWHPFTQAKTAPPPTPIVRGDGAYLIGADGMRFFDAISSWWVTLHGHAHPVIAEKIASQAHLLEQVIFTDFTHEGAIRLAERLILLLNIGRAKVFYSDNGSTAVETALKIALQFWANQYPTKPRGKIISFCNAYHGDTFGAMSASGKTPFNFPFWPYLFEVQAIEPPLKNQEEKSITQMKTLLDQGNVACFIFEPIVQGAAGMKIHSATGLEALIKLCNQYGVVTIADEVMTGFGRTGPLFACNNFSIKPDITCLSKGITGGFLPLGATVCKDEIYNGFLSDQLQKAFLHGHSYCANPLACAAALASLDLLENPNCHLKRQLIESSHRKFADSICNHPSLARCEVAGTILALEYKEKTHDTNHYFSSKRDFLLNFFFERNILIRPLGNVLYLIPPYCTSQEDLNLVYHTILLTLEKTDGFN